MNVSEPRQRPQIVGGPTTNLRCFIEDRDCYGIISDDNYVWLDDGSSLLLVDQESRDSSLKRCDKLNKRIWYVVEPELQVVAKKDPICTQGSRYPVFVSRACLFADFGQLLEEEMMTDETGNIDTQNTSLLVLCAKSLSIQSVINN